MRSIFLLIPFFLLVTTLFSFNAFAEQIEINKENYVFGETITISGKLPYSAEEFVGLQILNPTKSDIVHIDQFFPKQDGSFSKSLKAQGPKWTSYGIYTIKIAYNDKIYEKTFLFSKPETSNDGSSSTPPSSNEIPSQPAENDLDTSFLNPKLRVSGFPDPSNAPNYYYERYFSENEYKNWFDSTFSDFTIYQVVGYKPTHVPGFPDENNSPWYYVNRYHKEENYKDWFDSQFPTKSIYEILGYPESFFQKVPDWIKNNAKWWSSDLISDAEFFNGISYLINEGILIIPNLPDSDTSHSKIVPIWVKHTASWWAEGKIDENEFLKSIEFLVENGIIQV